MNVLKEKILKIRDVLNLEPDIILTNSGTWGPLNKKALHTFCDELHKDSAGRRYGSSNFMEVMKECLKRDREEVAMFLNCTPEEVALTESTTFGLNVCLWGLDLQPGDEIISTNCENIAAYPMFNALIARRGVVVKYADLGKVGEKDAIKAIRNLITPKTKAIMVSHVLYISGVEIDAKELSLICREKGIFSLIDGVQAAGTTKIDIKEIDCDAYCFARHKFLSGPDGAGILYVRRESLEQISPTFCGIFTDKHRGFFGFNPVDSVERFDISTRPFHVQAAAAATMKWLRTEVGYDFMVERIGYLRNMLYDKLSEIPKVKLLSIKENSRNAALLLFNIIDMDPQEVTTLLFQQKVYCRPLKHSYPPFFKPEEALYGIRISISYWNSEKDIKDTTKIIHNLCCSV